MTVSALVNLVRAMSDFERVNIEIDTRFYYICNRTRKHLETFRHLQPYYICIILPDMVDGLVDLERVIRR
jgi:hypothetical protein